MRAHPRHRLGAAVDPTHEPDQRAVFERMHHTVGANVRARRHGLPAAVVRDHFAARGRRVLAGGLLAAQQQAIGRHRHYRRCGGGRGPDDHLPPGGGRLARGYIWPGAVHLRGEPAMQIGQELLSRPVAARSSRLQVDRGADLRGLEVVGTERLGTAPAQQVVNIAAQPSCVHRSSFPLTCAANRQGQHHPLIHLGGIAPTDHLSTDAPPSLGVSRCGHTATLL